MPGPKPLLLVDADGVPNPYAAQACPEGHCEHAFLADEEAVGLAEVHGKGLRELAEVFELVWAHRMGEECGPSHCAGSGSASAPRDRVSPVPFEPRAKAPAIRSFVEERPLAWIDDVITPEARR